MGARFGQRVERQMLILFACVALAPLVGLVYLALYDPGQPFLFPSMPNFGWWVGGGTAVIYTVILLVVVRILRNRLLSDLEDVTRLLVSGDYSRRRHIDTGDVFAPLGRAFNDLTDQLEESFTTLQSVADIDRLILSSAGLEPVIRKVLVSAQMDATEVTVILRPNMSSMGLATYRLDNHQLFEDAIGLLEISEENLNDVDGYRQIAHRVCGEHISNCLPIAAEGSISGALVVTSMRTLNDSESKRLADLADRLSVAVTNIRRSDSLYHKAHFDDLTGLINRHAFQDRLSETISRSGRGEQGALLFIDLDDFKKVNDTEGHKAGDRLLILVGERLRETLRDVDVIARLGGDEFAVIIPDCDGEKSVSKLCQRIVSAIVKPAVVDRMEQTVGASIGVALFPNDGQHVEELIMKADSAMYRAKESGGGRFAFFDDTLNEANRYRVLVESRLREAIKRQELHLHFQPKLKLESRTVDSAEALMRWTDSELGVVEPNTFVPIAEETTLIHDFTSVLVSKTAELFSAADRMGVSLDHVAINASAKQLMIEGFSVSLLSLLDHFKVPHKNIELEVTESVFERHHQLVVRELEVLRSAGIRIALDDFGTGFSSLNMLRQLPLDIIKIDRSYITEIDDSEQARILVQHLISIAAALGMEVVAEGVDTDIQLQHLIDANCHYAQGYLISQPKSMEDFLTLVAGWQSGRAKDALKLN